ncbi:amidohydrolase family protein [Pseudomonas sp. NPDC089996]|uniref:amidohydrolase family protein n=1 Tax=Pseudomonas sp. NPDC089996 TaxID=3364474 RepID=UPI0037F54F5B
MTNPYLPAVIGVDTHAHIFHQHLPMVANRRYSPDYDAPISQYLAHLDQHGLSHGVLIQPSFLGTDNSYMLHALRLHPQRLRAVAVVDATISDQQLQALDEAGVVGIRLNLIGKHLADYAGPEWAALFRRLAVRGWQVEIQRGFDDLAMIVPAILACGVDVVVDHFGLPAEGIDPQMASHRTFLHLLSEPKLWLKLSAGYRSHTDLAKARVMLAQLRQAAGGIDRLLWGSDWPHTQYETQTCYADQYAFFEALLPDAGERAQVLGSNAARLFGFDRSR